MTRAVVASVRHQETDYDRLLMSGIDRREAREQEHAEIERTLDRWRQ